MIAFLIDWLSDLFSLNHPSVLFAVCMVLLVLILIGFERLHQREAKLPEALPIPPPARRLPDFREKASKGFSQSTVVPFPRQAARRG